MTDSELELRAGIMRDRIIDAAFAAFDEFDAFLASERTEIANFDRIPRERWPEAVAAVTELLRSFETEGEAADGGR